MGKNNHILKKYIQMGTFYGSIAWIVYAIIELFFAHIVPWVIEPAYLYRPPNFGFTVLLFIIYTIFGAFIGAVGGISLYFFITKVSKLKTDFQRTVFRSFAVFSVILFYMINIFVQYPATSTFAWFMLIISIFLTGLLILSCLSLENSSKLLFVANPYTIAIILVGLSWTIKELLYDEYSGLSEAMIALLYIAVVLGISMLIQKPLARRRSGPENNNSFHYGNLLLHISPAVLLLIFAFTLKNKPLRTKSNTILAPQNIMPNIILITLDTVRGDHTSLYGYERNTTPNLRKFAENAALYTEAIAPSDWTLSSHASIFTGMYPRKHGAYHRAGYMGIGSPLPDEATTLAEILSKRGYQTIGIASNYAYLAFGHNLYQGFQYYKLMQPSTFTTFFGKTSEYLMRQGIWDILVCLAPQDISNKAYTDAAEMNKAVFTLLKEARNSNNPFFMFINYMDAHDPYVPPAPYDTLFPGKDVNFTRTTYRNLWIELATNKHQITTREQAHLISQYDGEIAYLDSQLGRLIEKLKELGLYENLLLIITSDHGEALGERNLIGHHTSVYQSQVHIPLIIKYPKENKREIVKYPVSLIDLMPTVLDFLNFDISPEIQGESLLRLDSNQTRDIFSESVPGKSLRDFERFRRIEGAVYSGTLKFIMSTAGKKEMFNLDIDPFEKNNLYQSDDALALNCEDELRWILDLKLSENQKEAKIDNTTRRNLKSLGYIK